MDPFLSSKDSNNNRTLVTCLFQFFQCTNFPIFSHRHQSSPFNYQNIRAKYLEKKET